jgi:3-phenylpropionate/trans-cinnamate dioxygenase ferredoxin reductase subunit
MMAEYMAEHRAERIVIVGGGQAGGQAVETLRRRGHTGPITLIGDESLLPYQRPPLSKKFLAGALARDRLLIRHAEHYAEHSIAMRLGFAAVNIDRAARRVDLADGSHVDYDRLLLATGSSARLFPVRGSELAGVYYLRNFADVERLRPELVAGRRCVIVGGGYIGLEAASTCRDLGVEVTVLDAAERVMSRVVSPWISTFYEAEHSRRGVSLRCGALVDSFVPEPAPRHAGTARVAAVRLADGSEVPADFVLIAIGVAPNDSLARAAGIDCDNGILVDEYCRTSDPNVFAAGDCARHPSPHYGMRVLLESVDNAFEQAQSAALNMLGIATVHDKVPWFWSDQYDLKMIIVGLSYGHDQAILRGDPASRSFSVVYLKNGELIAVDTVNAAKDQLNARKLIPARARPDPRKLADPTIALKDC